MKHGASLKMRMLQKNPRLIRRWRYRIVRRNKNLLIIICGQTGSGKSFCALTIAKMINPSFNVRIHVVFTIEQFMELLNSGQLKKGDVVVWDEAGVGIPAREWYTLSNKAINYVLQTFRHLNLCIIFTVPSFDYIDKQTRLLFHVYIETVRIDYEEQVVIVKIFENTFNPRMGKVYRKYYWFRGRKHIRFRIGKPTKEMVIVYEQMKLEFSVELRREVEADVKSVKQKILKKNMTDEMMIEEGKNIGLDFTDKYEIMAKWKVGQHRAVRIQRQVGIKPKRGRPKKDK